MKNYKLSFAVTALAIVAFISVSVISCKKETENTLNQKVSTTQQALDLCKIGDVQAYLKDFKNRMTESKTGEAMSLNDAAWHLASLANIDFCKVNVEYDNLQFDTVKMNVNVTDGTVLFSDLNDAYEQMCDEINQFKQGFSLNNQNLYFINMSIGTDGSTRIALTISYSDAAKGLDDHHWYFPDTFGYIDSVCYYYFGINDYYSWNGLAATELQRILNLFESYPIVNGAYCYIPTRNYAFKYPYWTDPYSSSFNSNSRLFATYFGKSNLISDDMCYCLDSYLGLGYDYIQNNFYVQDEHPVLWQVVPHDTILQHNHLKTYYHMLSVQYGILCHDTLGWDNNLRFH